MVDLAPRPISVISQVTPMCFVSYFISFFLFLSQQSVNVSRPNQDNINQSKIVLTPLCHYSAGRRLLSGVQKWNTAFWKLHLTPFLGKLVPAELRPAEGAVRCWSR